MEVKQTMERSLYFNEIISIYQSEWYFEKEKVYVYHLQIIEKAYHVNLYIQMILNIFNPIVNLIDWNLYPPLKQQNKSVNCATYCSECKSPPKTDELFNYYQQILNISTKLLGKNP